MRGTMLPPANGAGCLTKLRRRLLIVAGLRPTTGHPAGVWTLRARPPTGVWPIAGCPAW